MKVMNEYRAMRFYGSQCTVNCCRISTDSKQQWQVKDALPTLQWTLQILWLALVWSGLQCYHHQVLTCREDHRHMCTRSHDLHSGSHSTIPYFLDYRSLRSISRMHVKWPYFPEKSIHKSHPCISRTGQQTCSAVYRPKQRCWWRVSGELDVQSRQFLM